MESDEGHSSLGVGIRYRQVETGWPESFLGVSIIHQTYDKSKSITSEKSIARIDKSVSSLTAAPSLVASLWPFTSITPRRTWSQAWRPACNSCLTSWLASSVDR